MRTILSSRTVTKMQAGMTTSSPLPTRQRRPGYAAVGLVFGIPAERMMRTGIVIRNASITELRFRSQNFDWQPDQLSLVTFNLTAHLPAELQTER